MRCWLVEASRLQLGRTLARNHFLAHTASQAIHFLEKHGYRVKVEDKYNNGTISKGGDWADVSLSEASDGKDHWIAAPLNAAFLLPHPIDQKAVESWFGGLGSTGCKLVARIDDVVTLSDWSVDFDGKSDVIEPINRFLETCAELRNALHAEQQSSTFGIGRIPSESVRITALGFDELETLDKAWHWKLVGGTANRGRVFGGATIENVKVAFLVGFYPWDHFDVSAEVEVDKGVDAGDVAKRLQGDKPVAWSPRAIALVDSGTPVESYGVGQKQGLYYVTRVFKFNGMTVGEFRKCIEDFAERAKKLPRR